MLWILAFMNTNLLYQCLCVCVCVYVCVMCVCVCVCDVCVCVCEKYSFVKSKMDLKVLTFKVQSQSDCCCPLGHSTVNEQQY